MYRKKIRCKEINSNNNSINKIFDVNGVYPADMNDELLNNTDAQKKIDVYKRQAPDLGQSNWVIFFSS